jgi:hypothetical protein
LFGCSVMPESGTGSRNDYPARQTARNIPPSIGAQSCLVRAGRCNSVPSSVKGRSRSMRLAAARARSFASRRCVLRESSARPAGLKMTRHGRPTSLGTPPSNQSPYRGNPRRHHCHGCRIARRQTRQQYRQTRSPDEVDRIHRLPRQRGPLHRCSVHVEPLILLGNSQMPIIAAVEPEDW